MGLTGRDAAGYRLRPDGQRVSLLFDLPASQQGGPYLDQAEIIQEGWKEIGVETVLKQWPLAVMTIREGLGDYSLTTADMAEMDLFAFPDWIFPTRGQYWHPQVGKWFESSGEKGEAPSGPTKELLDLYARIQSEKDLDRAHDLVLDAIRIHVEQGPFVLGTVADLPELVLVRDNFRNVPEEPRVLGAWSIAAPATSFPESFYFSEPGREGAAQ
jgi:peptide/nickel transport system substrate-binding protein